MSFHWTSLALQKCTGQCFLFARRKRRTALKGQDAAICRPVTKPERSGMVKFRWARQIKREVQRAQRYQPLNESRCCTHTRTHTRARAFYFSVTLSISFKHPCRYACNVRHSPLEVGTTAENALEIRSVRLYRVIFTFAPIV